MSDVPVDIRQTKISAAVSISEFGVIESHQMQDRGVQVVDIHSIFYRIDSQFVGRAVNVAPLGSAASEPNGETCIVVVSSG